MTWLSTWPTPTGPEYAIHETEQQAEAHAVEVVRTGRARVTCFQNDQLEECS